MTRKVAIKKPTTLIRPSHKRQTMNCYYQIDEEWIKGELVSMAGGTLVNFHSRNDDGAVTNELTLMSPQIMFHGPGFVVSGYQQIGDSYPRTYTLTSVEVRCRKPSEAK